MAGKKQHSTKKLEWDNKIKRWRKPNGLFTKPPRFSQAIKRGKRR